MRRWRWQINAALVGDLTRRADGELQTIRATAAAELAARARVSAASLAAAERAAQDQSAAHAEAAAAQIGRLEAEAAGYSTNVAAVRRRNNVALGASLVANVLAVLGIVISRAKL